MKYYNFKSILAAAKAPLEMRLPTESFYVASQRTTPYIEPTFAKVEFPVERPPIILVSAVGATGKTALAQVLSHQTNLPLLDLGRHKPVGDNTLTGLLTSTFPTKDLSRVFQGIAEGSYGVIIDGIDEGRSKTTEKGFEAFLDDIIRLCKGATDTSFVLLGRTAILDECWVYLTDNIPGTAIVTISPFDLESARKYIDAFTDAIQSPYKTQYIEARDTILSALGTAFAGDTIAGNDEFLSFIGYPPVLDAIVTLFREEKNYHRVLEQMRTLGTNDVEIPLLCRIADYILERERLQKVVPNIVEPLVAELKDPLKSDVLRTAYDTREQCIRLVSFCLSKPIGLQRIAEPSINEQYEDQLRSFLPEHPFISGRSFRNAVFESVALALSMTSSDPVAIQLVLDYLRSHKYSYHLIYLLNAISPDGFVPIECLDVILGSALEFSSRIASVELSVNGPEDDESLPAARPPATIEIEVEVLLGREREKSKTFTFHSNLSGTTTVNLRTRLSASYLSLPCDVVFSGMEELEFTAPVEVTCERLFLNCKGLILRQGPEGGQEVVLQARKIESALERIITNGVPFSLAVADVAGMAYPSVQYAETKEQLPSDPRLREKYLRLRRILMEFRSHSKGALARYKQKIEHERVLRNNTGRTILQKLLADGILTASGDFYFLQPDGIDTHLGISWLDLRKGHTSPALLEYLRTIG